MTDLVCSTGGALSAILPTGTSCVSTSLMVIPFCIGGRWQISTMRLQWQMILKIALVPEIVMALEQTGHVECYGLGIADDAHLTGVIHNTL